MQYYHVDIFDERTLSLPPQMTKDINHRQPVVLEHSTSATSLQDHSASRVLNEAMQHYQLEICEERTMALQPQISEAMNCHQPMVLEQSTSAASLKDHSASRIVNEAMHYYHLSLGLHDLEIINFVGGGQLPPLANTLDPPIILQHVITPCKIISTCSNIVASAFAQN
jgi:hypothetical protein